jgi:hypothetical protein
MRLVTHSLAVLALAAAVPAAAEDLTIFSKVTRDGGAPATTTSYISSDHARFTQAEGQEAILDLGTGTTTVIDGRKKEYFVITPQDWDQMRARVEQTMNSPEMKRAQEQMKNLPPEVQKRMESMMGGMASQIEVQRAGGTRKIAGYACENWTWSFGQMSRTEQCLTTELPVPVQTFDRYRQFSQNMMSMMAAMGPMAKGIAQMQEKMKDMKGIPLASTTSVNVMGRSTKTTTEVTDIKKGSIPASAWEVPAGYKKVDNPMLKDTAPRPRH